jgi:hypothetical protein
MNPAADSSGYESPFQTPLYTLPTIHGGGHILVILFFFIFLAWAAYSVIAAYHWFRYSHRSWLAIPAVVTHVVVSGAIILYIASGV